MVCIIWRGMYRNVSLETQVKGEKYSMVIFTKPVQVLFSDEQYRCLWKLVKEQQQSLASIVRDAVEQVYGITLFKDYVITESVGKGQLRNYKFYGMWKDRTDMADSAEWVRKHREKVTKPY